MRDGYLIFKKYLTSNGKTNRLVESDMLLSGLPESKKPVLGALQVLCGLFCPHDRAVLRVIVIMRWALLSDTSDTSAIVL